MTGSSSHCNANPFAGEVALVVQNNALTDIGTVRALFASVQINSDTALATQIMKQTRGNLRIVFSNPYASDETHKLYCACKKEDWPFLIMERGGLPDTIMLDTTGFLCDSVNYQFEVWNDRTKAGYTERVAEVKRRYFNAGVHLEPQELEKASRPKADKRRKRIFIPLQVRKDTVTCKPYAKEPDYDTFLNICTELASAESDNYEFFYKPHPLDQKLTLPNIRSCAGENIDTLLADCDAVLTYNSGVGLLAFLHGKPVICAGRSYYGQKGLAKRAATQKKIIEALESLSTNHTPDIRDRFLDHLTQRVYSDVKFNHLRFGKYRRLMTITMDTIRITNVDYTYCQTLPNNRRYSVFIEGFNQAAKRWLSNRATPQR